MPEIDPPEDPKPCELRSWQNIFSLSIGAGKRIRENDVDPDCIVGIARGGWVPARNLCDFLDVTELYSMKIEHWGKAATPSGDAEIVSGLNVDLSGKDVLLVDDLTDTGETMEKAVEHVRDREPQSVHTASLIHMESSEFDPDFHSEFLDEWVWIVFPWNVTEDLERFVSELLKANEKLTIEGIKKGLREFYGLEIDGILGEVMYELEHRNCAQRLGDGVYRLSDDHES